MGRFPRRRLRPRRLVGALLVLGVAALLGACGGAKKGPRIEIIASAMDGPVPEGLQVRSLREGSETYPLVRVPDEGPDMFVAPGAPDGPYAVVAPGGWGMLWPNTEPPILRMDAPEPVLVQLGKPRTLYVTSKQVGHVPGDSWAAETVESPPRPLDVHAESDGRGVTAVRFGADDWKGEMRAVGRMAAGPVTTEVRFKPPSDGRPFLARVEAAPLIAMRVLDVGRPSAAEGRLVRLRVLGIPLKVAFERPLEKGEVRFDGIPFFDRPLEVGVAGVPGTFLIDADEWMASQELRLLVATADAPALRVRVPDPGAVEEVQVLPPDGDSYGLVGFTAGEGALVLPVPAGTVSVLLRVGDRWAEVPAASGGGDVTVAEADLQRVGTASVQVEGEGGTISFRRVVGDRRVLGRGFTRIVAAGSDAAAKLPAGEYRVSLETRGRTFTVEAPVKVAPGASTSLRIDSRR